MFTWPATNPPLYRTVVTVDNHEVVVLYTFRRDPNGDLYMEWERIIWNGHPIPLQGATYCLSEIFSAEPNTRALHEDITHSLKLFFHVENE